MSPSRYFSDARLRKIGFSAALITLFAEYNLFLMHKGTHPMSGRKSNVSESNQKRGDEPKAQITTLNGLPIPHFVNLFKRD
ncbi:predicted protein [Plenodomus lingam JN3]|uniref:Predicted protein n=1 Tax=Leptosphaeria maculans (strain JN3 / isolate v23.1.3 / race Av1-4-5-6-7-8) TaxID=985895 RepID=E4ZRI2_LEPMJ|nr:predicted protein [Plenodomus lingam JN3]CBX93829.1 predicted protein [Plenodomus lingam JN3]